MGKIIWLASYPKSGNTWLRIFLHNLLRDPGDGYDINEIGDLSDIDSSVRFFQPFLKKPWTDWSAMDIANTRWHAQRYICMQRQDDTFVKTHNILAEFGGKKLIYPEFTAGTIYVVRNPLDVCISMAGHYAVELDEAIRILNDQYTASPNDGKSVYEMHGNWFLHVESWTSTVGPKKLVIRYEDMLSQPDITFGKVVKFLGLQPAPERITRAIQNSSFEKLREQEDRTGFRERPVKAERFFRVGKAGQWRGVLSEEQIERVVTANQKHMQRFGYWPWK